MNRKSPASMRSGFFVSVGVPVEMSYFRYDNEPTFFHSRGSALHFGRLVAAQAILSASI